MDNLWQEQTAESFRQQAIARNQSPALGERIYTSRLIGSNPDLVLHGGGNTSVKIQDLIYIKGSGWDLGNIEAEGLPALRLEPLLAARQGKKLSDPDMVKLLRQHLIDPNAPNPSVEALLHAFIPHKFVDHSHASAILVLANQPNSQALCQAIYGEKIAWLPYVMPGYDLSIAGAALFDKHPECEGIFLENHGLFTFAPSAEQSYARMIKYTSLAEDYLSAHHISLERAPAEAVNLDADFVQNLRQVFMEKPSPFAASLVLDMRCDAYIRQYSALPHLAEISQRGTITPDHVIRTKPWALILSSQDSKAHIQEKLQDYQRRYQRYFERHAKEQNETKIMLDPYPRLLVIEKQAVIGLGKNEKEAAIVADLAVQTAKVVLAAEKLGRYQPIAEDRLFEMEYWSLEQAKLKKN